MMLTSMHLLDVNEYQYYILKFSKNEPYLYLFKANIKTIYPIANQIMISPTRTDT